METSPDARAPRENPRASQRFSIEPGTEPWCELLTLADRRRLELRPIRPDDAEGLQAAFEALSPEDVRMRFMHRIAGMSDEAAARYATPDVRSEFALVLTGPAASGKRVVEGGARAIRIPGRDSAEFAVLLTAPLRGFGLARYLLCKLIQRCRQAGLRTLEGYVLSENRPMLALAGKLGFERQSLPDEPGVLRVVLDLKRA